MPRQNSAQKSATPKGPPKPRGKPFQPGNPWRIQPGEVRNPGGRPKLLSESYRDWLSAENEDGVTNAAGVAMSIGKKAIKGDVQAARELRQTTEGDKYTLDLSKLTDEQLSRIANGESPQDVAAAAAGESRAGAAPPAADAPGPGALDGSGDVADAGAVPQ